ncbi:CapA family protein [Cohnella cellulosilytica]|uniref:CapA family protein n=1 Tax=Cohnella cellulosilytica TaxID=986710 RepID=A0ABW2F5F5_9BACL
MRQEIKATPLGKTYVSLLGISLLTLALTACASDFSRALPSPSAPIASATSSPPDPAGSNGTESNSPGSNPEETNVPGSEPEESNSQGSSGPFPAEPETTEATLLAVGDIMVHTPQLPAYYDKASDSYDFTPWFSQVKPILTRGDWVVGNLETPIAGKDLKFTGYPRFNAPNELATAIRDAGIQLVSTANNHSLDRGVPGVARTLATVRKAGLVPFGTSESKADRNRTVIEERNGIRMGFLSYTYGTNGIPIPAGKEYAVNLIDRGVIKRDIAKLRQSGVDAVTVCMHFGVEYQRMPNSDQTDLARELVGAGADLILGSHPHVVQPYQEIAVTADKSFDGTPRRGIVIYSLGNFISNQTGDWKDVGVIFGVRLTKTVHPDGTSQLEWDNITTEPTWVHIVWKNKQRHYTVIPLPTELKRRSFAELTAKDYEKMQKTQTSIHKHLRKLIAS